MSYIYSSPGNLEECVAELQPDLQAIIETAEVSYLYLFNHYSF